MEWLNLSTAFLRSEDFLGCGPIDRATWVCLANYCASQENGGVIKDCDTWGDRKWQQVCGITKKESLRTCELWRWEGHDLIVEFYPIEQEKSVLAKRANGKRGGRPKRTGQKPSDEPRQEPNANQGGNEKECKEKKGKVSETKTDIPASPEDDQDDIGTPGPQAEVDPKARLRYDLLAIKEHGGDVAEWHKVRWAILLKLHGRDAICSCLDTLPIAKRNPAGVDAEMRRTAPEPSPVSLDQHEKFATENADYLIELERQLAGGGK